jgi:hypothetical protein
VEELKAELDALKARAESAELTAKALEQNVQVPGSLCIGGGGGGVWKDGEFWHFKQTFLGP